jgi:hypothetical protein
MEIPRSSFHSVDIARPMRSAMARASGAADEPGARGASLGRRTGTGPLQEIDVFAKRDAGTDVTNGVPNGRLDARTGRPTSAGSLLLRRQML